MSGRKAPQRGDYYLEPAPDADILVRRFQKVAYDLTTIIIINVKGTCCKRYLPNMDTTECMILQSNLKTRFVSSCISIVCKENPWKHITY